WDAFFSASKEQRQSNREACIKKTEAYDTELFGKKVCAVYQQAIDDFSMAYSVKKINVLNNGFVQLTLKRKKDAEAIKIRIPDDVFFELKIMPDTMLDAYTVDNFIHMQDYYNALIRVKRRVFSADYTSYEISTFCRRRLRLDEEKTEGILQALTQANLINDHQYALNKAAIWHDMGLGRIQIANKLRKAGIRETWIAEALDQLDDSTELDNATKTAGRLVKTIKYQSNRLMRQSLIDKLVRKGFSVDVARKVGESIELQSDDDEVLKKTVAKAKRLYSQLEGAQRYQKIRLYCMRKGFSGSQIDNVLEREEHD
ncbi:MAG: RecX family transcriptional regulator, partial [Erysipelotrichaceae bacterium]|nr:RecX family transcriptional regulator [Erysipelotrichaceae bacterium]